MNFETSSLLDTKERAKHYSSKKRVFLYGLAILAITGVICWSIPSSSVTMKTNSFPQFVPSQTSTPEINDAQRTMFVANYLSIIMGTSKVSQFENVVESWMRAMSIDEGKLSEQDLIMATNILEMMRIYEEMKVRRNLNDPVANLYWARISALVDLDSTPLFEEGNTDKVSGMQKNFWNKSETLLKTFESPRLISQQELADNGLFFQKESTIWTFLSGKAISTDVKGSMELNKQIIGTQILKDSSFYLKQESRRVLEEEELHEEFAPSTALIYLNLFENARIATQLTSEDQLFSRTVEKMIATWIENGHKSNDGVDRYQNDYKVITKEEVLDLMAKYMDKRVEITNENHDKVEDEINRKLSTIFNRFKNQINISMSIKDQSQIEAIRFFLNTSQNYKSPRIIKDCNTFKNQKVNINTNDTVTKWIDYCKQSAEMLSDLSELKKYFKHNRDHIELNQVAITQEEVLEIIKKFSTKSDTKKKTVIEVIKTINKNREKLYFDSVALIPEKIDVENKKLAEQISSLKTTKSYKPKKVSKICVAVDKETTGGDVLQTLSKFCKDFNATRITVSKLTAFNRNNTNLKQNRAENLAMMGNVLAQWMRGDASGKNDEFELRTSQYHSIHNSCNGAECDKYYRDLAKSAW